MLHREDDDDVAVLRLDFPRGNALGDALLEALSEALRDLRESDSTGVVLTGKERIFSPGLDLVHCWELGRADMAAYLDRFERLFLDLFTFPKPVVAALGGHAIAGGCVLSLAASARILRDGTFKIGMNEMALGVGFPVAAGEIVSFATQGIDGGEALLRGEHWDAQSSFRRRFADALVAASDLIGTASARVRELVPLTESRESGIRPHVERIDGSRSPYATTRTGRCFAARWCAPTSREINVSRR